MCYYSLWGQCDTIHASFKRFAYLQPFSSYWTIHFGFDFPTGGENLVVLGENDQQRMNILKNTCLEGTSVHQTASMELAIVRGSPFTGLGCKGV